MPRTATTARAEYIFSWTIQRDVAWRVAFAYYTPHYRIAFDILAAGLEKMWVFGR